MLVGVLELLRGVLACLLTEPGACLVLTVCLVDVLPMANRPNAFEIDLSSCVSRLDSRRDAEDEMTVR